MNQRLLFLAVRTGLEPATPCVTGMYSNQLNYRTITFSSAIPLNCDAKVGGLFELCKSCTHIFFIIFQSSLIINLLHRNFFYSYSERHIRFCLAIIPQFRLLCFASTLTKKKMQEQKNPFLPKRNGFQADSQPIKIQ